MSVAVCRGPAVPAAFEVPKWLPPADGCKLEEAVDHGQSERFDIWNVIQGGKGREAGAGKAAKPYVHPLVRRSSSLMSQRSLEVCTESLGSETGSGDFSMGGFGEDDVAFLYGPVGVEAEEVVVEQALEPSGYGGAACDYSEEWWGSKEIVAVNYRCSSGGRSPQRAFPPPLASMSRRDGPCLQMRPHRLDGRLVVEAVLVRPHGFLHAQRQGGRLRLCFVDCSVRQQNTATEVPVGAVAPQGVQLQVQDFQVAEIKEQEEEEVVEEEEMEEEEVEVVDRGTVVEVKVSTQPQTPTGAGGAAKVHRSTLVINKFVGSTPLTDQTRCPAGAASPDDTAPPPPRLRRVPSSTSTTTLAAAVAAALTATGGNPPQDDAGDDECGGLHFSAAAATKLLFASRRRDKQELLQSVRRCRQLRQKPLFILEPYCIATSCSS